MQMKMHMHTQMQIHISNTPPQLSSSLPHLPQVSSYGEKQVLKKLSDEGFDPQKKNASETPSASAAVNGFRSLADFVSALMSADVDGRVMVCQRGVEEGEEEEDGGGMGKKYFKFLMLNAAKHFSQVPLPIPTPKPIPIYHTTSNLSLPPTP